MADKENARASGGDPNAGDPVPVPWPVYTGMFSYLDLGKEIHQPTDAEKEIFRFLWPVVERRGENCTIRDFQTPDIMPAMR